MSLDRSPGLPLFSGNIQKIGDFESSGKDAHAIPGYSSHPPVARAVAEALGVWHVFQLALEKPARGVGPSAPIDVAQRDTVRRV